MLRCYCWIFDTEWHNVQELDKQPDQMNQTADIGK